MLAHANARKHLALALTCFLLAAAPRIDLAGAAQPSLPAGPTMNMNGYEIQTDMAVGSLSSGDFVLPHAVVVKRPGSDARADRGTANLKRGVATLIGNVVVRDSGTAIEGKAISPGYQGPATLTCDELTLYSKEKAYDARGHVHFTEGDRTATADRGVLNQKLHTLHLEGNVAVSQGQASMHARVVDYDLRTHDVIASGKPMAIRERIADATAPKLGSPGDTAYVLQTDTTYWNTNSGNFTMPQHVNVVRPGTQATSDKANGNSRLGTASLIGNVVVHDSGSAPEARDAGVDYRGPATITSDQLTIDSKSKTYDAVGNVRFVQGTHLGTAHRGVLDQLAHTLHLEGNVLLADGPATMNGDVVDYNLKTRDVIVTGKPMIIREPLPKLPVTPSPAPRIND